MALPPKPVITVSPANDAGSSAEPETLSVAPSDPSAATAARAVSRAEDGATSPQDKLSRGKAKGKSAGKGAGKGADKGAGKSADPDAPRRGPGRPRKDPSEVKRQVGFFLTDEERSMLKEMALLWGCTASQFLADLIRDTYKSKRYMKGFNRLTQDERAELVTQRQTTQFITSRRENSAMQRNLDRRMGMDRSLTNVMVIAAPQAVTHSALRQLEPGELSEGIDIPGIYCKNLGNVWIVPYGQLYRISVVEIIQYPCYASVLDYFAGKRIAPGLLSEFIEQQHDFKLSSIGEKAVQERLAKVYGSIRYPVKESFELKRRERMIAESQQSMAQMLDQLSASERSTLDHIFANAAHEAQAFAQDDAMSAAADAAPFADVAPAAESSATAAEPSSAPIPSDMTAAAAPQDSAVKEPAPTPAPTLAPAAAGAVIPEAQFLEAQSREAPLPAMMPPEMFSSEVVAAPSAGAQAEPKLYSVLAGSEISSSDDLAENGAGRAERQRRRHSLVKNAHKQTMTLEVVVDSELDSDEAAAPFLRPKADAADQPES